MAAVRKKLLLLLLASILLNAFGLYWAGDIAYRQITSFQDCQPLLDKNLRDASCVYSDSTTWLIRASDHDFYYVKKFYANNAFSFLKVEDLHSGSMMQCLAHDLLAVWSYDDAGRCIKILLVRRGKGLFDKNGDGKFRKLSLSEIDKVCALMKRNLFSQSDQQRCNAGNGKGD